MPFSNRFMKYPVYIEDSNFEALDIKYNYINIAYMAGNVLQFLLIRVLLDPINGKKDIDLKKKTIFCISVQAVAAIILLINIVCFVFVMTKLDESKIFFTDDEKTILMMWVEVQIVSVPAKILYYLITVWTLMLNRRKKKENLNNPDIKEAIVEGTGLQEQMDKYLNEKYN